MSTFLELAREKGYSTSSSAEDGNSKVTFQLYGANEDTPPPVKDIGVFTAQLCGGVDNLHPLAVSHTDINGGKVRRRLPRTHPYAPELSVAGITAITGHGKQTEGDSMIVAGLTPLNTQFAHYTVYEYDVELKRRPYFLLPDEYIERPTGTYFKLNNTSVPFYYAREWDRYTTLTIAPTPDTVNATTGGQMRFRSTGALNGTQYPGQTWMYMHNQIIEVTWYLVPYRYFFKYLGYKPYLTRFVNTVNQNEMFGYDPGQLLFLGATPQPFLPQSIDVLKLLGQSLTQSQMQLCNIKLRWLATTRESPDAPTSGNGLDNKNNIAAGHNLQPSFVDRQFHYVTTEDPTTPADTTKWFASFPSFPHELLFTDPMLIQPGGAI